MPSTGAAKKFLLESVTGVLILAIAGNALTWVAWALLQPLLPSGSIVATLQARIPFAYVLVSGAVSAAIVGLLLDRKYLARIKTAESHADTSAKEREAAEKKLAKVQNDFDIVLEEHHKTTPEAARSHDLAFRIAAVVDDASTRMATCNLDDIVRKLRQDHPELRTDDIETMVGRLRAVGVITTVGVGFRMAAGWEERLRRHITNGRT